MGMAKYIEREAFLEDAEERYCLPCKGAGKDHNGLKCRACWVDDMCGDIIGAPAADVAPVRHGRWELYGNDDDLSASFFCSLCGWNMDENEYLDIWRHLKYCPNCGAKMDEVSE